MKERNNVAHASATSEGLRRVDDPISLMLGISGVVGFLVFVVMMAVG
jgi:hypothetical protein